ncbi:MAG: LTA synthase family protein [Myxococcota bacterium]|nr:LTA synthase family protein [Myxococcota bacterium]
MPDTATKRPTHQDRAIFIFALALLSGALLKASLYLRPGPYGVPFVLNRVSELFISLFYEGFGLALICLPFFIASHLADRRNRPLPRPLGGIQIFLCFASLIIGHADHEIQRFMGIHISINYLQTYGSIGKTPAAIGHAIADDAGGAYSAYLLIAIPIVFLACAVLLTGRFRFRLGEKIRRPALLCSALLFYIAPAISWYAAPDEDRIFNRVRPPAILVYDEINGLFPTPREFKNINDTISKYRNWWHRKADSNTWVFTSNAYPLRKQNTSRCPTPQGTPWRFILLQLETFRAKDMQLFNPHLSVQPTPFIDALGRDPKSAYWPRCFCNGLPTVVAFMAMHTGLMPHSEQRVATAFTHMAMEGFPEMLRRNGYHTAFFSGPDPDWDNERFWLNQWYDHVVYNPAYKEIDRPLFQEAAQYLKKIGKTGKPFFVSIVSISNHIPFRSPEPELNITDGKTIFDRLHNTMRYTDDVVREFYEAIREEPWFERTVLIITGDHGYDLGDRGWVMGHENLRRESTWVPLILHGAHPALPSGAQPSAASHVDLAPTVLDLAGICPENSFMGHSLLKQSPATSSAVAVRDGTALYETADFSAYFPKGAPPMLFEATDVFQERDISTAHKKVLDAYRATTHMLLEITDYAYEKNRIVPVDPMRKQAN